MWRFLILGAKLYHTNSRLFTNWRDHWSGYDKFGAERRRNHFRNVVLVGVRNQRGFQDFWKAWLESKTFKKCCFGAACGMIAGQKIVRDFSAIYRRVVNVWKRRHEWPQPDFELRLWRTE